MQNDEDYTIICSPFALIFLKTLIAASISEEVGFLKYLINRGVSFYEVGEEQ